MLFKIVLYTTVSSTAIIAEALWMVSWVKCRRRECSLIWLWTTSRIKPNYCDIALRLNGKLRSLRIWAKTDAKEAANSTKSVLLPRFNTQAFFPFYCWWCIRYAARKRNKAHYTHTQTHLFELHNCELIEYDPLIHIKSPSLAFCCPVLTLFIASTSKWD